MLLSRSGALHRPPNVNAQVRSGSPGALSSLSNFLIRPAKLEEIILSRLVTHKIAVFYPLYQYFKRQFKG